MHCYSCKTRCTVFNTLKTRGSYVNSGLFLQPLCISMYSVISKQYHAHSEIVFTHYGADEF